MSTQNRLVDITSAVINSPGSSNFQRRKPLPLSNAHLGHTTSRHRKPASSPNFMIPTRASRTQQQPGSNEKSRPTTSSSLKSTASKRKASTLMASASKMLKPNSSKKFVNKQTRSQYASLKHSIGPNNDTAPSSQIPIKKKPSLSPDLPQPLPAQRSPPPVDKPLPSLPVATIVTKSTIQRRSLIDATERPLRRSISPQTGQQAEEEWPALSPERPALEQDRGHRQYDPRLLKPGRPSIGDGVIEGLRQLNIHDPGDAIHSQDCESNKENIPNQTLETLEATVATEHITPTTADSPASPISSPPERLTGYRKQSQKVAPVIRQNKTSAMRMRLSTGSIEGLNDHVQKQSEATTIATNRRVGKSSVPQGHSVKNTGPIRSKSRLRHMATGRGSPYTIPPRFRSRSSEDLPSLKTSHNVPSSSEGPRSASTDSLSSVHAAHLVAVKDYGSGKGRRKTSIPLPSRLIRHFPNEESEAEIPIFKHRKGSSFSVAGQTDPSDADIDTDHVPEVTSSATTSTSPHRLTPIPGGLLQQPSNSLLTFSELMATPAPSERELNPENESPQGSIHGYDENGGFKIKKLRGRASQGATLRISDSAKRLLAPKVYDHEDDQDVTESQNGVAFKDQLRKSSDLIKTQVQLTRSITERSRTRLSGTAAVQPRGTGEEYHTGDPEDVGDQSIIARCEPYSEEKFENKNVDNEIHEQTCPGKDDDRAGDTPSNTGQGDWPLKDFKSLASATKGHSARESIDSSWIPPADWETSKSPDLDVSSPPMAVLKKTPVTTGTCRNHFSSPVPPFKSPPLPPAEPNTELNIPSCTPETDSIFKRKFPPRTTSMQKTPGFALSSQDRNVPSVHEIHAPDFAAGLTRKSHGPFRSRIAIPSNTRSFTQSISEIDDHFKSMEKPTASSNSALKSRGKKQMSTIRSLFHKKSGEIKGSFRVKRKHPAFDISQISSPVLATPTPLANVIPSLDPAPAAGVASMPAKAAAMLGEGAIPTSAPAKLGTHLIEPLEIRHATQTALQVLDMARMEPAGRRQDLLVELGKATVEVLNASRNAEKALEQAKAAVTKTEIYAMTCNQAVADVVALVEKLLE